LAVPTWFLRGRKKVGAMKARDYSVGRFHRAVPALLAAHRRRRSGSQLLRAPTEEDRVEFVTIMRFDSWDAVKRFSGEDYERAYVPPKARRVLERFDERSRHYEVREQLEYRS
jgi:hypothetical protein